MSIPRNLQCVFFVIISVALVGCGAKSASNDIGAQPSVRLLESASMAKEESPMSEFNREQYNEIQENEFLDTMSQPQSTFSVDVDTASYANVRRFITEGNPPPVGAVRLEELVNYFTYDYPEPEDQHPFSVTTDIAPCPWNPANQLLRVGLKGQPIPYSERSQCNLVFLLDVSGSMMNPDKLPLVKSALRLLIEELAETDRIAIVVYAGASGLVLDSTSVAKSSEILSAIEELRAGGSTNGGEGIQLAYRVARDHFVEHGVNRVILCTDGDFNVGITDQSELVRLIQQEAKSKVYLSVLGFGRGNLNDAAMEKLADKGNGNYAYIDSMLEARKVLVEQIGGTLITIAKDVKIQVDFNPVHVQSYRLLGYENRMLENRDFRDDTKDAGEIGAGHTVTAFYELVPKGSSNPAVSERKSEFVRPEIPASIDLDTRLTVNLRYKLPDGEKSSEFQVRLPTAELNEIASTDFQFASSVLAYGMLLRQSQYAGSANWDWVINTAESNIGEDPRGIRSEFVQLAKTAKRIMD